MQAPVTAIIPCYRCKQTIARAVESIAKQSLLPAEVILVDDDSDDGTFILLQELRDRYPKNWIKVFALKHNGGASVARNLGWEMSTQNYIAFLDADDAWHPQKIEIQYSWMRDHPDVALCGHNCVILDPGGQVNVEKIEKHVVAHYLMRRRLLISNPFATPSFMLRRNLPYQFDPSRRYTEDFFLLLQVSLGGYSIATLDAELVYIFKKFGETGISGNLFKMRCGDIKNYWKLWRLGQLNFISMIMLVMYSIFKFIALSLVGPKIYFKMNRWLYISKG